MPCDWLNIFTKAGKLKHVFVIYCWKSLRTLTNMEKSSGLKRPKRQETRRKKIVTDRIDLFVASYVQNKYPAIYTEAEQFNNTLRQRNPNKLDLRKTDAFRVWAAEQKESTNIIHGRFNRFELKVPLINIEDIQTKAKPLAEGEPGVVETLDEGDIEAAAVETPGEGETMNENTIQPSIEAPISDELFNEILKGLREDPDLSNIISSLEEEMTYNEYEMDIHISDDERLENQLL